MRADRAAWVSRGRLAAVVLACSLAVRLLSDIYMRAARMLPCRTEEGHEHDRRTGATTREADVCVVGAGLAGLTAARLLQPCRQERGRAQGPRPCGRRVWTTTSAGGVPVDMGGCFVGPGHDRLRALAADLGVRTFATFVDGDNVLATGGTVHRYRGDIPRINPVALLSAAQGIRQLDAMARRVPVDAPWDARAAGVGRAVRARLAHPSRVPTRLPATSRGHRAGLLRLRTPEVSLLLALPGPLGRRRGAPHERRRRLPGLPVRRRRRAVTDAMAAELGDAVVLRAP